MTEVDAVELQNVDFEALKRRLIDAAFEALVIQCYLIVGLAQIYVNVDTGKLRDTIRLQIDYETKAVTVLAGGLYGVDYASIVEARYGYMARAVAEVQPTIAAIMEASLGAVSVE